MKTTRLLRLLSLMALLLGGASYTLHAQQTHRLSDYIAQCPLIDVEARGQIVEAMRSLEAKGSSSEVFTLQANEVSNLSITLMPMPNGTPVICVIETLSRPRRDSYLRCFSPQWQELDARAFIHPEPRREELLAALSLAPESIRERLRQMLTPLYWGLEWGDGATLRFTPQPIPLPAGSTEDELNEWLSKLPILEYRWRGVRFERQ